MAKVIAPKDARVRNLPGRLSREIVAADIGAVGSTVRLVEIEPDAPGAVRRGPHVHFDFEESIYVLEGEGIMRTDGGEYPVRAGDTVLVPAGEKHATYNTGTAVLRLICFFPINDIRPATVEFRAWDSGEEAK